MKKIMFSIAAMAIMGAASYVTLRSNDSDREFTALELANIEALTYGEGSNERYLYVTRKTEPESAPGCVCSGRGTLLCCDHQDFPGWN